MALTVPKLTVPKLALPKLELPNKKTLTIVGGVVVVVVAGWFGWRYFEDNAAPPAKPQPAAAKQASPAKAVTPAPSPDKVIADVLAASGLNQHLDQLPQQLIGGVKQSSAQRSKASPAILAAIEKGVTESFTAQSFHERLNADLKKNFDQKRMKAVLADFSTPEVKRMTELERASPPPQELAEFVRGKAASKLSPARSDLIKRIDAATRASDLAVEAAFASMKAVASGVAGARAVKAAAVDKAIEKQRISATANIRNSTFANLAFTYRDASDTDLERHAKLYEAENSKWFSGIVYASLLEEIKDAAAKAGERIAELISKPGQAASLGARPARSKSGADARACLDRTTDAAIIKCAEQYR